jgi:hypothetical protein
MAAIRTELSFEKDALSWMRMRGRETFEATHEEAIGASSKREKQSLEVALRVEEYQMITAHLSGGCEHLLNGLARRPHRHKVRLV